MDSPRRYQRSRAKGWRMPPNSVYVGRPSKSVLQVLGCFAKQISAVSKETQSGVATIAKCSSILARLVVVIPSEILGVGTDFARRFYYAARSVGPLVVTGPRIGFGGTSKSGSAVTEQEFRRATGGAGSGSSLAVDIAQPMPKALRLSPRLHITPPQMTVITGHAKTTGPSWLATTRLDANSAIMSTWGGRHV